MDLTKLVVCLVIFTFIAATVFIVIAPSLNITIPAAPTFPTLNVEQYATDSSDWMTIIGSLANQLIEVVWFVLQIIGYVILYIAYIFVLAGVAISFFSVGAIPPEVAAFVTAIVMAVILGVILNYLRGAIDEAK